MDKTSVSISKQYIIQDKTIIFDPEYNEQFDTSILEILSNSNTIKFDNYKNNKYMRSKFNQQVDNLPKSIVKLTFGEFFNQRVDNLPNSIVELTFGYYFNQQVDMLPESIINLTFDKEFDQPVDNLPNSIISLTFGDYFNQPVANLPNSLTSLTFGTSFNQLVNSLPIGLKEVYIRNLNPDIETISNSILKINPNIKITVIELKFYPIPYY